MNLEAFLAKFQFLQNYLPLKLAVVVVVYAVLAKIVDLAIDRVLMKIVRRTKIDFDEILIPLIHGPICWTVFAIGLLHALVLGSFAPPWQYVLPSLVKSSILFGWWVAVIRIINAMAKLHVDQLLVRGKIGHDFFSLFKNLVRVVVIVLGALWFLSIWQVNLGPLFASAGIVGIAVALAAKDTLANFFGGISIFLDKTFKVGDFVIIDSGERGEVYDIGIRSTRIMTRDDVLITLPNSILVNSKIVNESAPEPRFRIRVAVGVAYGTDLDKVERVLLDVAAANQNVATEPAPRVRVRSFGSSSVDLELLLWVNDPRSKGLETHHLLKAAYVAFAENGITIPFPQLDLHMKKE